MKEFMKQNYNANPFPPISTYKLIKCLRMNRRDSGRVSPLPSASSPREISKCRHHRTFFNFLTLNDFIYIYKNNGCVQYLCMYGGRRNRVWDTWAEIIFILFYFIYFFFIPCKRLPPPYLNEAANKSPMPRAKAERQQSGRNNRRARIIKLAWRQVFKCWCVNSTTL